MSCETCGREIKNYGVNTWKLKRGVVTTMLVMTTVMRVGRSIRKAILTIRTLPMKKGSIKAAPKETTMKVKRGMGGSRCGRGRYEPTEILKKLSKKKRRSQGKALTKES